MHSNIFKVDKSYYVYLNAAITIKLFIYIYIMLQACTHHRFQVIFPIGGVEVVGNTRHIGTMIFKGVPMAMTIGASACY